MRFFTRIVMPGAGSAMPEICVAHLVRENNGEEPFKRFLDSYRANPGGREHDLLIIFKGFSRGNEKQYIKLLAGIPHQALFVRDFGFDIRGYYKAARIFHYNFFCFLNSYSVVLDKDWLAKMHRYASREDTGLVGATGSYESIYSVNLRGYVADASFYKRLRNHLRLQKFKIYFDPFPNYHVRTNGFMIRRELLLKIKHGPFFRKRNMHWFESGKNSLTKQILDRGLKVYVVGKNGKGYEREEWCASDTFRQRNQDNLLIADNQTMYYEKADFATKAMLSKYAWGDRTCS